MPADTENTAGDPELAWRVLGLLNLYRLVFPSVLVALTLLASRPQLLGAAAPALYFSTLVAWFATGVLCIALLKTRWPNLQAQAFIHVAFDIVAITMLLVTSGGAASGAGLLLILPVAAVSLLLPKRTATTVGAIAALCVLGQQIMLSLSGTSDSSDLTQAGLLGGVILIAALAVAPLAGRLRESEALVRQRDLDLANLAEHGMLLVAMPNRLEGFRQGGSHWGPVAWTNPRKGVVGPTEEHLAAARAHGRHVAECTARWLAGAAPRGGGR